MNWNMSYQELYHDSWKKNVKIRELTSIYLCFNCGKVKKKEKKVKAIKNNNGRCKKTTRNCFFRGHFKFSS